MDQIAVETMENTIKLTEKLLKSIQEDRESVCMCMGEDLLQVYDEYIRVVDDGFRKIHGEMKTIRQSMTNS